MFRARMREFQHTCMVHKRNGGAVGAVQQASVDADAAIELLVMRLLGYQGNHLSSLPFGY